MEKQRLWEEYRRRRDKKTFNFLVESYLPLVKKIVSNLNLSSFFLEEEDVLSAGVLGLIQAIQRFDSSRGVPFEFYAIKRIKGAIFDELRRQRLISRKTAERLKFLKEKEAQLEQKLGREASEEELSKFSGYSPEEINELWQYVSLEAFLSLDEFLFREEGETSSLRDNLTDPLEKNPEAILEEKQMLQVLKESIEELEEKEKIILSLYYEKEFTLKEIGQILGITESRVCQLHGRTLNRLKSKIEEKL